MAASDIDQKILGRIAKQVGRSNQLLSQALYQVLGLSVLLSRRLSKARRRLKPDNIKDANSRALHHQILWLSREGLAITEVYVLPFCQDATQLPHARVMAAKLRASFHHVFCLFHNYPPVSQLTPPKTSPAGKSTSRPQSARDVRARQAVLRETIPSIMSDASYVTNPYAFAGPATTPPPSYPLPPIPTTQSANPTTPVRPLLMGVRSPLNLSPPSPADFIMPPANFVPAAATYFAQVESLARKLLPGSDPLRLSVTFESCAFAWECGKDFALAKERARSGVREAHAAPEAMDDNDFKDASMLVAAMKAIASRSEEPRTPRLVRSETARSSSHSSDATSPTLKATPQAPSMRVSPRRPRRPRSRQTKKSNTTLAKKDDERTKSVGANDGDNVVGMDVDKTAALPSDETAQIPIPSSSAAAAAPPPRSPARRQRRGSARSEQNTSPALSAKSEKERKRRIMEQAEEKLKKRQASVGDTKNDSAIST